MSTEINSPENKHTPGTKGEIWGEGRLGVDHKELRDTRQIVLDS